MPRTPRPLSDEQPTAIMPLPGDTTTPAPADGAEPAVGTVEDAAPAVPADTIDAVSDEPDTTTEAGDAGLADAADAAVASRAEYERRLAARERRHTPTEDD